MAIESIIHSIIISAVLVPAFISLEQSIYVTSEGDVTVEICAVLTVENGSTLMDLDPAFVANLNFMTVEVPDSATGIYHIPVRPLYTYLEHH